MIVCPDDPIDEINQWTRIAFALLVHLIWWQMAIVVANGLQKVIIFIIVAVFVAIGRSSRLTRNVRSNHWKGHSSCWSELFVVRNCCQSKHVPKGLHRGEKSRRAKKAAFYLLLHTTNFCSVFVSRTSFVLAHVEDWLNLTWVANIFPNQSKSIIAPVQRRYDIFFKYFN